MKEKGIGLDFKRRVRQKLRQRLKRRFRLKARPLFSYIDAILKSPISTPDQVIGFSRENRPIHAAVLGEGDFHISLIAGCHADEPVGPRLLRKLYAFLSSLPPNHSLLTNYRWWLVPHANPDGEAVNKKWYSDKDKRFDLVEYMKHAVRELPGEDVEFSFPYEIGHHGQRPENEAIHKFWVSAGREFDLHASLHGMMVAAGPWFLIEREWIPKSELMQKRCRQEVDEMRYVLHDVDRRDEKGFRRISDGFCTRPDSKAMQRFFIHHNDLQTAEKFYPSSMEAIRALGGDPLTIVSEMPLFIIPDLPEKMVFPDPVWNRWNAKLQGWKNTLLSNPKRENEIRQKIKESGIKPMPVNDQMRLQWRFITAAVEQVLCLRRPSGGAYAASTRGRLPLDPPIRTALIAYLH